MRLCLPSAWLPLLAPPPALLQVSALQEPSELTQFVAAVLIERRLERGGEADKGELLR
jgi:hypothetical protein